jgi:hypothetical protein
MSAHGAPTKSYVKLENRIPENHPLHSVRELVDQALLRMDGQFEKLYADWLCGLGSSASPSKRCS